MDLRDLKIGVPISLLAVLVIFSASEAYSIQSSVEVGNFPKDIDIDPSLNNLYIPNYESGTVSIIDSESMIIKNTISINDRKSNPTQITVDTNRHLVFVSDKISGVITVIDGIDEKIIDSVKIGGALGDIDINEKNKKLYVSDIINNKIIIINSEKLEIIKSISISQSPWSIAINEKTNTVYVASGTDKIIHIIDGKTDNLSYNIDPNVKPWGLSINEKNNLLYVTSWDSNEITVINLHTNQIINKIPIISGAWQIDTNQNTGITIISNEHTNELYLLGEDSKIFQTIQTQDSPQSLTISPSSNIVYVTNPLSNSVSAITYEYEISKLSTINEDNIYENDITNNELILEVVEGIAGIPQRQEIDNDLISGLLENIGVTGEFDGNEIANLLIDDYNKKQEFQPKTAQIPSWTTKIAMMFADDIENRPMPENINCDDHSFSPIHDIDNTNAFEIWIKILPICALS